MSRRRAWLPLAAAAALALPTAAYAAPSPTGVAHRDKAVCAQAPTGYAACHARVVTKADGATPNATTTYQSGFTPDQLRQAYLGSTAQPTTGSLIAIVDAYASPNAQKDLDAYRTRFGLGSATIAQYSQTGGAITTVAGDTGWGQEEMLDLEMASAVCPKCSLMYVGANSAAFADLSAAVKLAASKGARVISNSYGGREFSGEQTATYSGAYDQKGVAVTVSSGDSGYGAQFPASAANVIDVGGTALKLVGTTATETAWSSAGSGCSAYVARPTWQSTTDSGCSRRMGSDISAVADPNTGVAVYDSYGSTGGANWFVFGGTSVAAPLVGGLYAVAANGVAFAGYPSANLWTSRGAGLYDPQAGSNGRCKPNPSWWCNARAGYDGPTGWGSPRGLTALH